MRVEITHILPRVEVGGVSRPMNRVSVGFMSVVMSHGWGDVIVLLLQQLHEAGAGPRQHWLLLLLEAG